MEKFEEILKLLISKISDINFVLLGSLNLRLQGIEINPSDIDFLTDNEGIKKISQIFNSKILKTDIGYLETIFEIDGIGIHFVANISNPVRPANFMDHTVLIEKNGIKIPCTSLEAELEAYRKMNRDKDKEKIKLIEEYLKK
jgi:predicted nucleotidyltransferase